MSSSGVGGVYKGPGGQALYGDGREVNPVRLPPKPEKCTSLTNEQIDFACKTFVKWMNICEDNKRGSSAVDVSHSSLLLRLLAGEPLHENPPPRAFSYPAWHMVEKDEFEIHELHEYTGRAVPFTDRNGVDQIGTSVVIDQAQEYVWEDKEKKLVRHVRLGIVWELFEREVIPKVFGGAKPEDHKYMGKFLRRIK